MSGEGSNGHRLDYFNVVVGLLVFAALLILVLIVRGVIGGPYMQSNVIGGPRRRIVINKARRKQ